MLLSLVVNRYFAGIRTTIGTVWRNLLSYSFFSNAFNRLLSQ